MKRNVGREKQEEKTSLKGAGTGGRTESRLLTLQCAIYFAIHKHTKGVSYSSCPSRRQSSGASCLEFL